MGGAKADTWWLRRHPADTRLAAALAAPVPPLTAEDRERWLACLDDVAFTSDGALPFRDNAGHARRHGVNAIAEPGGSVRSPQVEAACLERGIVLVRTGLRLFHH